MEVRRELKNGLKMAVEKKDIMIGYVRRGRKKWRIIGVYINGDVEG